MNQNNAVDAPQCMRQPQADEISLYDLYCIIVRRKLVVLSVCVGALVAAGIYLVLAQPIYEAKIRLVVPKSASLFFSRPAHSLTTFDSLVVFNQFYTEIQSSEKWKAFAAEFVRPDAQMSGSLGSVIVKAAAKPGKNKDAQIDSLEVVYQTHAAKSVAEVLRRYLAFTVEQYNSAQFASITDRIAREKEVAISDIALLRQKAKLERADEIERLQRDIKLAESLGISKYMLLCPDNAEKNGGSVIGTSQTVPNYMRGSLVLKAELEALQKRESDDAYIIGLRDKEINLGRLDDLRISMDDVLPYEQVGEISSSSRPVKPDKKLVIVLAVVLGLISGVLAAFFVEAVARGRAKVAV